MQSQKRGVWSTGERDVSIITTNRAGVITSRSGSANEYQQAANDRAKYAKMDYVAVDNTMTAAQKAKAETLNAKINQAKWETHERTVNPWSNSSLSLANVNPLTGESRINAKQAAASDIQPFKTTDQIKEENRQARVNAEYAAGKKAGEQIGGVLGAVFVKSAELNRDFQNTMTKQNLTRVVSNTDKAIEKHTLTTDAIHTWRDEKLGWIPGFTTTQQKIDKSIISNPWASAYRDLSYGVYNYARTKPLETGAIIGSTLVGSEVVGAAFGAGRIAVAATGAKGTRILTPIVESSLKKGVGARVATVIGESPARTIGSAISKAPVWTSKAVTSGANTYFEAEIAKGGVDALYGEGTTKDIVTSGAAGAAVGYATGGVSGAASGAVAGTKAVLGTTTANRAGFLGYAGTLAVTLPFFGAGDRKVTNFFSRASANNGPKVAGWHTSNEVGKRTSGLDVVTSIEGKPVKDTILINGEPKSVSELHGKPRSGVTITGESLGKDKITTKHIQGSKKEINPSLSADAYMRNARATIGELANEGVSMWSPARATVGAAKTATRLAGQGVGLVRTDVVEISESPFHPIQTRGAIAEKLASGEPIEGIRAGTTHSWYQELQGTTKSLGRLRETGVPVYDINVKVPHLATSGGGFTQGNRVGIHIPGTSKTAWLPISVTNKTYHLTPGQRTSKLIGQEHHALTRSYSDAGRITGSREYDFSGQGQYINPKLNPNYYEVGSYFVQKGDGSHEIQIIKNIKPVNNVISGLHSNKIAAEINRRGKLTPTTHVEAGSAAMDYSAKTDEPVAMLSPKTASGVVKPESEVLLIHNSPWATAETGRKFTGWSKSGTPIYEISYGNQPKPRGKLFGQMLKNASYNWKNALTGQGEYVKGMSFRANRWYVEESKRLDDMFGDGTDPTVYVKSKFYEELLAYHKTRGGQLNKTIAALLSPGHVPQTPDTITIGDNPMKCRVQVVKNHANHNSENLSF